MKPTTTRTPVMLVLLALAILLMARTAETAIVDAFSHAVRAPMSIDGTTSAEGAKSLPGSFRDMRSWLNNRVVAGNEHGDKLKAPVAGNEHGDKNKAPVAGNEHGDKLKAPVAGNEHGDKLKAPVAGNEHGDKLKAPIAGNEHGDRWQKALGHMG